MTKKAQDPLGNVRAIIPLIGVDPGSVLADVRRWARGEAAKLRSKLDKTIAAS